MGNRKITSEAIMPTRIPSQGLLLDGSIYVSCLVGKMWSLSHKSKGCSSRGYTLYLIIGQLDTLAGRQQRAATAVATESNLCQITFT